MAFYQVRPITEWTEPKTPSHQRRSRYTFKATYDDTERARAIAHPDRQDGDRTLYDQVDQAAQVLGLA